MNNGLLQICGFLEVNSNVSGEKYTQNKHREIRKHLTIELVS